MNKKGFHVSIPVIISLITVAIVLAIMTYVSTSTTSASTDGTKDGIVGVLAEHNLGTNLIPQLDSVTISPIDDCSIATPDDCSFELKWSGNDLIKVNDGLEIVWQYRHRYDFEDDFSQYFTNAGELPFACSNMVNGQKDGGCVIKKQNLRGLPPNVWLDGGEYEFTATLRKTDNTQDYNTVIGKKGFFTNSYIETYGKDKYTTKDLAYLMDKTIIGRKLAYLFTSTDPPDGPKHKPEWRVSFLDTKEDDGFFTKSSGEDSQDQYLFYAIQMFNPYNYGGGTQDEEQRTNTKMILEAVKELSSATCSAQDANGDGHPNGNIGSSERDENDGDLFYKTCTPRDVEALWRIVNFRDMHLRYFLDDSKQLTNDRDKYEWPNGISFNAGHQEYLHGDMTWNKLHEKRVEIYNHLKDDLHWSGPVAAHTPKRYFNSVTKTIRPGMVSIGLDWNVQFENEIAAYTIHRAVYTDPDILTGDGILDGPLAIDYSFPELALITSGTSYEVPLLERAGRDVYTLIGITAWDDRNYILDRREALVKTSCPSSGNCNFVWTYGE